ncbi:MULTISPECIES: hypothetical protein [Streptosporangiaceae]|uniref:hypothetical protein n=1 Tax=Streptosporangiaceae TaxID=2004 RepID=UPI0033F8F2F0
MNEDGFSLLAHFGAPCEPQKVKDYELPVLLKLSPELTRVAIRESFESPAAIEGRIVTAEDVAEAYAETQDGVRAETITWDGKRVSVTWDDAWL